VAGKEKVQFNAMVSAQEAAQYLESLARGMRERSMLLESGDSSLTVEVPDEVKLELEIASDGVKGKSNIDLSISWRQRREDEAASPAGLLILPGSNAQSEAPAFAE